MTAIITTHGVAFTTQHFVPSQSASRKFLLLCGLLSSVLYVVTDVLGGVRYPGYSFSSQAVSELMAIGAPSERFVDPMFLISGVFALAFGVGVFREGLLRNRRLEITGVLLIVYAAIGFTGPTLFEMHQRGSSVLASDTPHLVVTGVLVSLLLLAIGFGAFALDTRFRFYSLATLLTVVLFGVLCAPYAARLATHQPTPGLGVLERIDIYTSLAWVAVLGIVLVRQPRDGYGAAPTKTPTAE